ncbi:hypothetical protein [Pseudarthrobacter sp. NPDC080039]|uniref:hypothetical protein n=1 Tax=unclassified Pseudarthrobacter TaxID=2647000 RepID=UPI00344BEB45
MPNDEGSITETDDQTTPALKQPAVQRLRSELDDKNAVSWGRMKAQVGSPEKQPEAGV